MSANVQTMFYAGQEPWHGLGTKVEGELTAEQALVKAGLNWAVEKRPMFFQGAQGPTKVNDNFAIVRTDKEQAIGVVGNVYTPLLNKEAFSFFDSVVGTKEAIYHTAGALGQGEKIWILAKIDGVLRVKGNDVVDKYLLLANSHDGSTKVLTAITPVRVVCQNTLHMAVKEAESIFRIRHTASMGSKVADVKESLGLVNKFFLEFEERAKVLASVQVTASKFDVYLESLGFKVDSEEVRDSNKVDQLRRLFETGKGNDLPEIKGTAWAAYNAVTQYLTHERPTRVTSGYGSEQEARLNSNWFGSAQKMNNEAFDKALLLTKV